MDQASRLQVLKKIIESERVASQGQLLELLREQGLATTQPSLSRDLQKLGVVKVNGIYAMPGVALHGEGIAETVDLKLASGTLVIVKSGPGSASRLAYIIDEAKLAGVAGTISGDDTIFVAVNQDANPAKVLGSIQALFAHLNPS